MAWTVKTRRPHVRRVATGRLKSDALSRCGRDGARSQSQVAQFLRVCNSVTALLLTSLFSLPHEFHALDGLLLYFLAAVVQRVRQLLTSSSPETDRVQLVLLQDCRDRHRWTTGECEVCFIVITHWWNEEPWLPGIRQDIVCERTWLRTGTHYMNTSSFDAEVIHAMAFSGARMSCQR